MTGRCGVLLALVVLLAACSERREPDSTTPPPSAAGNDAAAPPAARLPSPVTADFELQLPRGPWTELAQRLTGAPDLATAVSATREVLARGGIATSDGQRVLVEAIGPASRLQASPAESVGLAAQARHRAQAGSLTVSELAQMLETLGWPFPEADPQAAAESWQPVLEGEDAEAWSAAVQAERQQASAARREAESATETSREALRLAAAERDEELRRAIQDATVAWQQARRAAQIAPPEQKAAAEAALQTAQQARQAAIDARNAAQLQAREARDASREAGSTAREQERIRRQVESRIGHDYEQGERLMAMLGDWVRAAAAAPEDPRSFTPLFLAEMARRQDPPLDLAGSYYRRPGRGEGAPVDLRGAVRSRQLRLTLLEIQLLAAAFDRGTRTAAAPRGSLDALARVASRVADRLVSPALAAAGPCDAVKSWLDQQASGAGDAASAGATWATGKAIDAAAGDAVGRAVSALGLAAKLAKLAAFYGHQRVTVTPEPLSVHKPTGTELLVAYVARAGISQEDWDEYERALGEATGVDQALRDCTSSLGVPRPTDAIDMANEAEKWWVEWRLHDGEGNHVTYDLEASGFDQPGRLAMRMKRESDTTASATLIADVLPEEKHSGDVVRAYATAEARVDAAGMPSPFGSLVSIATGGGAGLADTVLELLTGWYQEMNKPKAYGTIELEYHCPRPGRLHRAQGKVVADGAGDPGPSNCLLEAG